MTSGTTLLPLLRGTLAALRCRELVDAGRTGEACIEFSLLADALAELETRDLPEDTQQELESLRATQLELHGVLPLSEHWAKEMRGPAQRA